MRCKRNRRVLVRSRACRAIWSEAESTVTVTADQSAVLYDAATTILGGIGDIAISFGRGDWRDARKLRSKFDPLLRLLDDLGWSEAADATAITMAPAELARALATISTYAVESLAEQVRLDEEDRELRSRFTLIGATCSDVRRQLEGSGEAR